MSDTVDDVEKKSGELNNKSSVGAKILMFLSGVALYVLLFSLIPRVVWDYFTVAIAITVFFVIGWAIFVFGFNLPDKLKCTASKNVKITSIILSIIFSVILLILSGTSLKYCVQMASTSVYLDALTNLFNGTFLSGIFAFILDNRYTLTWVFVVILCVLAFFILYFVLAKLFTSASLALKSEKKSTIIISAIASGLWVFVPLLSLYLTNMEKVDISFILILSVVYVLGTLFVFLISLAVSKSSLVSFCICVLGWIGLSISDAIITGLMQFFPNGEPVICVLYCLVLLIILVAAGYGLSLLLKKLELNSNLVSKCLLALVAVLIVINAIPLITYSVSMQDELSQSVGDLEFNVDSSLEHPNIYWIHGESMVDPTVLEKYWGTDTVQFSKKLEDRGFYVNHNAFSTSIAGTTYSMSSLLTPSFYDTYKDEFFDSEAYLRGADKRHAQLSQDALARNNEFINAFDAAGYTTNAVTSSRTDKNVPMPAEVIYAFGQKPLAVYFGSQTSDLENLCVVNIVNEVDFITCSNHPLGWLLGYSVMESQLYSLAVSFSPEPEYTVDYTLNSSDYPENDISGTDYLSSYAKSFDAISYVSNNVESPSLTIYEPGGLAHYWFSIDENGNRIDTIRDESGYYGTYLFSEKILLMLVDIIQHADPNAIIVIQGDHGFSGWIGHTERCYEAFGQDADLREIKNHVVSAIYIPEQYQTDGYQQILENPRNIVRYLINTYVGQNYDYVEYEDFIKEKYL